MQELSLMQKFADPELFKTLSLAEKLEGAGVTTLMGMGITFVVLIFLWAIIAQMAKFSGGTPKGPKSESASSAPAQAATASSAPSAPAKAEAAEDSSQLIAVITAAIAALQESTGATSNLIIRKISRVSGPTTSWSAAGSADAINSRKF